MHKHSHMDSRRLAIFLSVVDEGGFTAAGDALAMSQPAVSQAVRELEADLGTLLFHRLGRAVKLTAAGEALVLPARQARYDLHVGRQAVEEVASRGPRIGRRNPVWNGPEREAGGPKPSLFAMSPTLAPGSRSD